MADRDVEFDLVAGYNGRGVRDAIRDTDRLRRRVRDGNRDVERDAKKTETVFSAMFGGVVGKAQRAGILAGDKAVDGFADAFKALPPEIKAGVAGALAAGAIAAAPVVVAAVDSALLLGLGAGGLAAGIALAAQDAEVQRAYSSLGQHIEERLHQSVLPFKGELIGAAGDFQSSFDRVAPSVDRIFKGLATTIRPLAQGFGQALENAAPGIERAFAAAVPLLRDLATWLPKLGDEIGDFADAMADAGPEARIFFRFVLGFIDQTLTALTKLFEGAAELGKLLGVTTAEAHRLDSTSLDNLDASFDSSAKSLQDLISQVQQGTVDLDNLAQAMTDKVVGAALELDHANLSLQESLTQLGESFKENGRQLDIHTAKGQANREAVLSVVESNLRLYDSQIQAGISAEDAAAAYDANTKALEAQLRKAGLTTQQIDGLIGKYRQVPDEVNTNLAIQGLTDAVNGLAELLRQINGIPSSKTVTITTRYRTDGTPATGHSRNTNGADLSALDGWRPAEVAGNLRHEFAEHGFTAASSSNPRALLLPDIHNDVNATILIDGSPVRAIAKKVARAETKRQQWKQGARR